MGNAMIVLPSHDEMSARLLKVDEDSHVRSNFHPLLLKFAGQQRTASGVVMTILLAMSEYLKGMPPMMGLLMHDQVEGYIDALVTDPEAKREASAFHQQVLGQKSRR